MNYSVDMNYLVDTFKTIVNIPSPVGYYVRLNPVLEKIAADLGLSVTYDNKATAYITVEGEDNSKTVLVGAHADTLGLVVRHIDNNGMLLVRALGGVVFSSIEGESVTICTRDGRTYSGLVICKSHSGHVFSDSTTLNRDEDTIRILIDADVHSKADVKALGIQNGDYVCVDPHCEITENGYIKSRYIDDKCAIACSFAALKYITENNLKPKYNTIFAFPYSEEIGFGGTYVPEGVSEYIALDIGLIGPELEGSERTVSICAKDAASTYHYELTSHLIELAQKAGCDYAVDVYYRYGTDAHAAIRAGNDLRDATFGMAVYCSHGRERTHVIGLENTTKLLLAYMLNG